MTSRVCILLIALLCWRASADGDQMAPEPHLQVGVFGYRADGTAGASAYETQLSRSAFVYTTRSGCGVGAGPREAARPAAYAWTFTGKILSAEPQEIAIQLNWQRVMEDGKAANGPGGSVHLTLRPGERVLLDAVPPGAVPSCWTTLGFEARYGVHGELPTVVTTPAAPGGGTSSPASSGTNAHPGAQRGAGSAFAMDLWLTVRAPGRPEQWIHRALRIAGEPARFAFDPVALPSAGTQLRTIVSGRLTARRTTDGQQLMVHLDRRLRSQADPVDGAPEFSFAGTYPFPGPGDVLSLEMPSIRLGAGEAAERFSLRIRATPIP